MRALFSSGLHGLASSFGLLVLRLAVGGMLLFAHGWGKLTGFEEMKKSFMDPLGIGANWSLTGAVAAEVFCSALLILGLATRPAALGIAFTMGVAAFMVHSDDPFGKKELALLYLAPALTLLFTGAGAISFDRIIGGKRSEQG